LKHLKAQVRRFLAHFARSTLFRPTPELLLAPSARPVRKVIFLNQVAHTVQPLFGTNLTLFLLFQDDFLA